MKNYLGLGIILFILGVLLASQGGGMGVAGVVLLAVALVLFVLSTKQSKSKK